MSKTIADRIKKLVDDRFGGNVKAFARKCTEVDSENAPNYETIRKYMTGGMPGLDKAEIMARAAGVTVHWLATGKESEPDQITQVRQKRNDQATDYNQLRQEAEKKGASVEKPERPATQTATLPRKRYMEGEDFVLSINIVIKGRGEPIEVDVSDLAKPDVNEKGKP